MMKDVAAKKRVKLGLLFWNSDRSWSALTLETVASTTFSGIIVLLRSGRISGQWREVK